MKSSQHVPQAKDRRIRNGTIYGALSIALLVCASSLTFPHLQSRRDELGCDAMCYGSLTSARSCLSLIGATMIGRISDLAGPKGRKMCLFLGCIASLVGMVIASKTFSIQGLWLSMIPVALLQQNFSILKAMVADLHDEQSTPAQRSSSMGTLGMAVGLAFMVGPLVAATLLKTFDQANALGMGLAILSMASIFILPDVYQKPKEEEEQQQLKKTSFYSFLNIKAARTPGAILLMVSRVFMALAFHVFQTIWSVALKSKFDFGPSDYGKYLSFIGLTYALSQGFLSKFLLEKLGGNKCDQTRVRTIIACCIVLGLGRLLVYHTGSLVLVYFLFTCIVTALGMINTILTADTSYLSSSDEIGSLFGLLASVESGAGMIGPILGGALSYVHPVRAPLLFVAFLYACVSVIFAWGYEKHILAKKSKVLKSKTL